MLDITLLKDIYYLITVFGLAVCTISEINFIAILPLFLFDVGFNKGDVTIILTVYYASDLVVRLIYTVLTALFQVRNRTIYIWNAFFTIFVRVAFSSYYSFWWLIITTGLLGISRCLIQTPMPVVIAERYSDKFSSALSFYMVVTGISSIILGAVMGFVRTKTQSSVMVFHVLTVCILFCVVPWTVEIIYKKIKKKRLRKQRILN